MASRSSPRTQGEFRDVIELMYHELIRVHPWLDFFLRDQKFYAAQDLDSHIHSDYEGTSKHMELLKLVDILRK